MSLFEAAVNLRNVSVRYTGVDGNVLENFDLLVGAGERVVLKGRSGSGKSTILNVAAGMWRPSVGSVLWRSEDIWKWTKARRQSERARCIGWVDQECSMIDELSLFQNIAIPRPYISRPVRRHRSVEIMERLQILHLAHSRPRAVSGGERQRAALARALVVQPSLLILDEPTSALDEESAHLTLELIKSVSEDGCAVLVASHDPLVFEWATRSVNVGGPS